MDDSQLIRKLESEVLDQEYRKYPILGTAPTQVFPYFLKNLGDIQRDLQQGYIGSSPISNRTFLTTVLHATGHCLRWALEISKPISKPFTNHEDLTNQAGDLLQWAVSYSILSADHIAWSRGIVDSEIDRTRRVISFHLPPQRDYLFLVTQHEVVERESSDDLTQQPLLELRPFYLQWVQKTNLGFRLRLSSLYKEEIPLSAYQLSLIWLQNTLLPEVEGEFSLGEYTVEQFRRIYAGLFVISQFQAWDEDVIDRRLGPDNFAGSVILELRTPEMIEWLARIGDVSYRVASHFLRDLTLKPKAPRSTLSTTPFVSVSDAKVFLLARLPSLLSPSQVLTSILSSEQYSGIYDRLIQSLEERANRILETKLAANQHWRVYRNRSFRLQTGVITPDIVLCDDNGHILIIEYKHILTPLNPIQALSRIKNYSQGKEGLAQIKKYVSRFLENEVSVIEQLDVERIATVTGVLLFGNPMPILLPETPSIFKIDRPTFEGYIDKHHESTISELILWLSSLPNRLLAGRTIELVPREILVSDWTYVHWYVALRGKSA